MGNKPDKLKEIRDKWFTEWGLNPNVRPDSMFPLIASEVQTIQSETYQLADKEWQAKYDLLQSKYDLLVEDKLDMKQLGREDVIKEIEIITNNCFGDSPEYRLLKLEFIAKLNELRK